MIYKIFKIGILTLLCLSSCEIADFDLQENPNNLTASSADPDLLLNGIQGLFDNAMAIFSRNTDDVMRYEAMTDTYADVADPSALDGEWEDIYRIRENVKILESLVEADERLRFHRGMAKVLNAYCTATLVDYFGDVPFTEANSTETTLNPATTPDEEIYAIILADIDLAIDDLNNIDFVPITDLFFGGDASKWIKAANSLKLKMLINMGDSAGVSSLMMDDNLINSSSDDFEFTYGISVAPESRHPYFIRGYLADGFSQYIGNNFLWLLKDSKSMRDPRLRYYVYRQSDVVPTGDFLRCDGDPIFDYCYVGDFYWGRDHGYDIPSPADRELKTVYGVYPGAGTFDQDNPAAGASSPHLGGAGIFPIILSSYVQFLKAEAVLSLGVAGDAAVLLESGIRASMNKVLNFKSADSGSSFAASDAEVDAYVAEVMGEFAAASGDVQLDIVMREYYLASYGNSIESYNGYRRTGFPSALQAPIFNTSIPFPRTYSLPDDAVNNNTSLSQRPITTQVFWDTNPAGFIK